MRGDSLYCPLSLSLDSYGNCMTDCIHCYFRHLNHTWGKDLKPTDVTLLDKKLTNGLKNTNPKTTLAHALSQKKTIRWGNKTDPFQLAERKHKIAEQIFPLFIKHDWSFVIQTKFTHVMLDYVDQIMECNEKKLITVMPIVSPGLEKDWETFEHKLTTNPLKRLKHLKKLLKKGVPGGVNGEPFIPGFHKVEDFENTLKLLKEFKIKSYNTYNFHFNAFVAKRMVNLPGVDIEQIWYYNQDKHWKPILQQLLNLSKKHGILLGCPDFVNSGKDWLEKANTCCGIDVPNPCTFNSHYFKKYAQLGKSPETILQLCNDGTGNYEQGCQIVRGEKCDFYTLKDTGL